jgi:hypothetical protein
MLLRFGVGFSTSPLERRRRRLSSNTASSVSQREKNTRDVCE